MWSDRATQPGWSTCGGKAAPKAVRFEAFDDADSDDVIIYQKDVYLQPGPVDFDPPVLERFLDRFNGDAGSPAVGVDETSFDEMGVPDFDVEAVSGMHVLHNDGRGNEQVTRGEQPLDRDPDVRVELMAFDPASVDSFQHYVVFHWPTRFEIVFC